MANRSHNRSPSPNVFIRHPHSFIPLSGQNIPPPPNWKPPPLPTDVDDLGSNVEKSSKSEQSSVSSVCDSGHLKVPNISTKGGLNVEAPLKQESNAPISIYPNEDQVIDNKIVSNSTEPVKRELEENVFLDNPTENLCLITDTANNSCDIEEKLHDGLITNGDLVLDEEIPEVGINEEISSVGEKRDEMSTIDKCDDDISCTNANKDNVGPITMQNGDPKSVSPIGVTSDILPKMEEKVFGEKGNEQEEKTTGSINISKLEDELDLLPIPDFPSLKIDENVEVLPIPEFPVPENTKKPQPQTNTQHVPSTSSKDSIEQDISLTTLLNQTADQRGSVSTSNSTNDRNRSISNVKSMESNLENITSALKLSTVDSDELESSGQEITEYPSKNCSNDETIINGTLRPNENENPPHVESTQPYRNNVDIKKDKKSSKPSKKTDRNLNAPEMIRQEKSELTRKPTIKQRNVQGYNNEPTRKLDSSDATEGSSNPASLISRLKNRANSDRRNSLAKTLTRLEPYLLVASSPPEGIRSQRLAELGVTCVVHAATILGDNHKGKGLLISRSEGIDIINANLEDGGNNLETFDSFGEKIKEVKQKKGVALIISDESSPSISQR